MRYIDQILQPGETLLYSTTLHWIVYGPAIVLLAVAIAAQLAAAAGAAIALLMIFSALCAFIGMLMVLGAWFRRWTTEIDVTDRRIVYKRGLVWRHTVEMNMDKVESVDVDQSALGRILNYGDITIRGTGTGLEPLRRIGAPLEFRNQVTAR
jgi:uncharacterized membrane protein YdbT with pleckstrin-like domain